MTHRQLRKRTSRDVRSPLMPSRRLASVIALGCALAADGAADRFVGNAFDDRGRLLYVERHELSYAAGAIAESTTTYVDPEDRMIGNLVSRFEQGIALPTYAFRDVRTGYEDGAAVTRDGIRIFRARNGDSRPHRKTFRRAETQVAGQGFHHFLAANLDRLARGEVLHIRLVLPSVMDEIRFRVRRLKTDDAILAVRLEIDNWFFRLFAPHVDAEYDLATGRLLRYRGISNIADETGRHPKVTIQYVYDDSGSAEGPAE